MGRPGQESEDPMDANRTRTCATLAAIFSLGAATMTVRPTTLLEDREILALLEQPGQQWAAPVTGWKVETGEDSLDYPAIWVWVILETIQEFEQRDAIRKQVQGRIAQSGEGRWVYNIAWARQ